MHAGLSRRRFLRGLAAGSVLLLPAGRALATAPSPEQSPWLSFSRQPAVGPAIDIADLDLLLTPLHAETLLAPAAISPESYQQVSEELARRLAKKGKSCEPGAPLHWTYRHYGTCTSQTQSLRLLSYVLASEDYLYSRLSSLASFDCHWRLLKDQASSPADGPTTCSGLVGGHNYLVHRISATDRDGKAMEPCLVIIVPVERAINYIVDDDSHAPISSIIYLIHGPTALISPFTEAIHLHTHQASLLHAEELAEQIEPQEAQMLGRLYGEIVTEAAGLLMAEGFLQQHGEQNNQEYRQIREHTARRYPLVKNAIALMRKHGVERTLRYYMDDPATIIRHISVMVPA